MQLLHTATHVLAPPLPLARPRRRDWRRRLAAHTDRLRASRGGLLALALLVGAGTAGAAVLFRWLIGTFTRVFTGHTDYAAVPGAANPHLPGLGRWFVVLAPGRRRAASTGRWCTASPARPAATASPR